MGIPLLRILHPVALLPLLLMGALGPHLHQAHFTSRPRPNPADTISMARWLVESNSWGVISTTSVHLDGISFGNVASYSDGPLGNSTGTPYFYLSKLDPTARDLEVNPNCSFAISESPLGTCGSKDVENPTCAKITLSGQMQLLNDEDDKEYTFAAEALFSKHPEMSGWPKSHRFHFYKLVIRNIFLIDWFGGAKPTSVDDYLNYVGCPSEPCSLAQLMRGACGGFSLCKGF